MSAARTERRWINRPQGSTWGDFGADDQRGRLNLLTPACVLAGVEEVREGLTFCLSLPLDLPGGNVLNGARLPPVLRPTLRGEKPAMNLQRGEGATDIINDDLVVMHLQYSTQWDSLAHVGQRFDADGDGEPESVYYNGYRAGHEIIGPTEAKDAGATGPIAPRTTTSVTALGIENMATSCVQGRGVMIDLHAHVGREHVLIGHERLMEIIDADGVTVEQGDLVCLHTGFGDLIVEQGGTPTAEVLRGSCAALDGRDPRLLQWITDTGLAVLVADNVAVEAVPASPSVVPSATLPLHEHCLFKLGVHLGELWYLGPLARWLREHGRSRFLLTAPPLRLPGAVGSPATPVATV